MKETTLSMKRLVMEIITFAARILNAGACETVPHVLLADIPSGVNQLKQRIRAVAGAEWVAYHVHHDCLVDDGYDEDGNEKLNVKDPNGAMKAVSLLWIEYILDGKYEVAPVAFFEDAGTAHSVALYVAHWEAEVMLREDKEKCESPGDVPPSRKLLVDFHQGVETNTTAGFEQVGVDDDGYIVRQAYALYDGTQRYKMHRDIWHAVKAECCDQNGNQIKPYRTTEGWLDATLVDFIGWDMERDPHSREELEAVYRDWLVRNQGVTPAEAKRRLEEGGLDQQENNADRSFLYFMFQNIPLTNDVPLLLWRCDTKHILQWRALDDRKVRFFYGDEDSFMHEPMFDAQSLEDDTAEG